ncbi:hypothetical protein FOZ63_001914, partial [Perkinsus olseni]
MLAQHCSAVLLLDGGLSAFFFEVLESRTLHQDHKDLMIRYLFSERTMRISHFWPSLDWNLEQMAEETIARQIGIPMQVLDWTRLDAESLRIHGEVRAALKSMGIPKLFENEVKIDAFWGCDMLVTLVSE